MFWFHIGYMYIFDCLIFMSIFILNKKNQENPNVFA
jgi:hypothetical protein